MVISWSLLCSFQLQLIVQYECKETVVFHMCKHIAKNLSECKYANLYVRIVSC